MGTYAQDQAVLEKIENYLVDEYEVELNQAKHAVSAWKRDGGAAKLNEPQTDQDIEDLAEAIYSKQDYWPDN